MGSGYSGLRRCRFEEWKSKHSRPKFDFLGNIKDLFEICGPEFKGDELYDCELSSSPVQLHLLVGNR